MKREAKKIVIKKAITKPVTKSTKAEIELRVALVYKMLIEGFVRKDIVQYGSKKWNISNRQVDDYIAGANLEIKENFGEKYKANILEKEVAKMDNLYRKNYQNEDYRECRTLIESKAKLMGYVAPVKTDITTNGQSLNLNDTERDHRINELKKKLFEL